MKKLLITLTFFCMTLCVVAQKVNFAPDLMKLTNKDKLAVMMVHFGTTHPDTRKKTIDKINTLVEKKYPNAKVCEAYTSRIVIRRLKAKGVDKPTPEQLLAQLHKEGYTHVLVQSTHVIEGVEMESLRREVESAAENFKEVRIGNPMLYQPSDYEVVIDALQKQIQPKNSEAVILVGHGTYTPITASYAMLDYMFKAKGLNNWHVGTIEGFPTFDDTFKMLEKGKHKRVILVPLMFVAGEHAKKDIAGEWKESLEEAGYEVSVVMEGLGENPTIQQLFIDHLEYARCNKHLDIMSKKKRYAGERE